MITHLKVKLENTQKVNRRLSDYIGTTIITSSSSSSDGNDDNDDDRNSYEIDQKDFEFAAKYIYNTNVSSIIVKMFH